MEAGTNIYTVWLEQQQEKGRAGLVVVWQGESLEGVTGVCFCFGNTDAAAKVSADTRLLVHTGALRDTARGKWQTWHFSNTWIRSDLHSPSCRTCILLTGLLSLQMRPNARKSGGVSRIGLPRLIVLLARKGNRHCLSTGIICAPVLPYLKS